MSHIPMFKNMTPCWDSARCDLHYSDRAFLFNEKSNI